jgi:hypothetical protein
MSSKTTKFEIDLEVFIRWVNGGGLQRFSPPQYLTLDKTQNEESSKSAGSTLTVMETDVPVVQREGVLIGSGGSGLWDARGEVEALMRISSPEERTRREKLDKVIVYGHVNVSMGSGLDGPTPIRGCKL